MNRAEKKSYRMKRLESFYNEIEYLITSNQKRYEDSIQYANDTEDQGLKESYTNDANSYIEENEVLTTLLNDIYKLM